MNKIFYKKEKNKNHTIKKLLLSISLCLFSLNAFSQIPIPTYLELPISDDVEFTKKFSFFHLSLTQIDSAITKPYGYLAGTQFWVTRPLTLTTSKVGIGTNSPEVRLHVVGDQLLTGNLSVGNSSFSYPTLSQIKFQIGNAWTFSDLMNSKTIGYNYRSWDKNEQESRLETGAAAVVKLKTDGSIQLGTAPSGPVGNAYLTFNYFTMLNDGKVGIGMTQPKFKLDVNGDANFNNVYTNSIYFPGTEMKIIKIGTGILPRDPEEESNSGRGNYPGRETGGEERSYTLDIMTFKADGKVGIGTDSPTANLHVNGTAKSFYSNFNHGTIEGIKAWSSNNFYKYLQIGTKGAISGYNNYNYFFGNNWTVDKYDNHVRIQQGAASAISLDGDERIYLMTAPDGAAGSNITPSIIYIHKGNLGIGAHTPCQALDVRGSAYIQTNLGINEQTPRNPLHVNGVSYLNGNTHITGNVGIGSAPSTTYRLGVNGTIGCKKIVVTNTGWADYVFEPDYELMPLDELESFIQENKRLPEVPPASHVEENGIELSEMNVLLLKKVEELTLYILQQNKDMQALKEEVNSLKEGR